MATLISARRGLRLRADRRPPDHDPGEHHRHPRDVLRHEPARSRPRGRRRVPPPARSRLRSSRRPRARDIVLTRYAKRSVAIFLGAVRVICIFGLFEDLRPTIAAEDGGTKPLSVTPIIQMVMLTAAALMLIFAQRQGRRHPGHVDLQVRHGRDDRPLRHRLDGGHVHRQQRGRDRLGPGRPREPVAVHDRGRDLRGRRAHHEPIGCDENHGPARADARHRSAAT